MQKNKIILLAIAAGAYSISTNAQNSKDNIAGDKTLQEVVVTATGTGHLLKDVPVQTEVISHKMIESYGDKLVEIALQWQSKYGVAPQITSVISEFDAAMLVGMSESDYSDYMQDKTAVSKGADFVFNHQRYQVKANRPSGKPGSKVTMVPKATNYLWDKLIWILYDQHYVMLEAWEWDVEAYKLEFDDKKRISPNDYRKGKCLFTKIEDKV